MSTSTKKALILPLGEGPGGEKRGIVLTEDGVSSGTLCPVEEGKPIMGDLVTTRQVEGSPFLLGEITEMPGRNRADRSGPSMVNSPAFQAGWERIFGNKGTVAEA